MKILAVIGSPRGKGAGYQLVKMIEERMAGLGEIEFNYLFLKDAHLKPCLGCYTCLAKGEDKCPLQDGRKELEQKLLEMDGVILSSPMHVLNVSGLMDNFIARFAYANHRPQFHKLKVLTIVNSGGNKPRIASSLLRWALGGSRIGAQLGITTPPWLQTQRAIDKKMQVLDVAARKFYRACQDQSLPRPGLYQFFQFQIRKEFFLGFPQVLEADYAFYKDRDYYYQTTLNSVKLATAKAVAKIAIIISGHTRPGNIRWPVGNKE